MLFSASLMLLEICVEFNSMPLCSQILGLPSERAIAHRILSSPRLFMLNSCQKNFSWNENKTKN